MTAHPPLILLSCRCGCSGGFGVETRDGGVMVWLLMTCDGWYGRQLLSKTSIIARFRQWLGGGAGKESTTHENEQLRSFSTAVGRGHVVDWCTPPSCVSCKGGGVSPFVLAVVSVVVPANVYKTYQLLGMGTTAHPCLRYVVSCCRDVAMRSSTRRW